MTFEFNEGIDLGWDLGIKQIPALKSENINTEIESKNIRKSENLSFQPMNQLPYAYPGERQISTLRFTFLYFALLSRV